MWTASTTGDSCNGSIWKSETGFLSAFCPGGGGGGGQIRLYGLLGGQVRICVQSMWQTRGIRGYAPLENLILDLLLDAILVESGTVLHKHNLPFIVSLKLLQRLEMIYMSNSIIIQRGAECPPERNPVRRHRKLSCIFSCVPRLLENWVCANSGLFSPPTHKSLCNEAITTPVCSLSSH